MAWRERFAALVPLRLAEADARCAELRELNAQMLAHFRKQQWYEALQMSTRCRKLANGFDLSGLYDMYPPGPDWDGVYKAETK